MKQLAFSEMEYSNCKKKTKRGRKPISIETMLRMDLMQTWFNLSDEGIEDSITFNNEFETYEEEISGTFKQDLRLCD